MVAKGDLYECRDCGLIAMIEEPCGCQTINLICCGNRMRYSGRKRATKKKVAKKTTRTK